LSRTRRLPPPPQHHNPSGNPSGKQKSAPSHPRRGFICRVLPLLCPLTFNLSTPAAGDPNRLIYGIDSYGFTCGSETKFRNVSLDLSSARNQYFLNPLDLMSIANIPYAKSICVDGCPGDEDVCDYTSLPCTRNQQFK
jgi:hypothetical protein